MALNVGFGFSNVLCDVDDERGTFKLRQHAIELLEELKRSGHKLILWTSRPKRSMILWLISEKQFFSMFDRVIFKGDFELAQNIPGCSTHDFKNVKNAGIDCLIETKPKYKKYSESLQLADRYYIVEKYRECLYKFPTKWLIKVLGDCAVENYERRVKEQASWAFDVLQFVENLDGKMNGT